MELNNNYNNYNNNNNNNNNKIFDSDYDAKKAVRKSLELLFFRFVLFHQTNITSWYCITDLIVDFN